MALTKLDLKPGINKEGTTYTNEGGYFSCEKVRFRSGYAEKLGGWTAYAAGFKGVAGTMMNWVSYDSANLLGIGTNQKYYVENSATFHDVTPVRSTATSLSGIFTGTSGNKYISVSHTSHGAVVGAFVTFSGVSPTTLGGVTMNAEFEIVAIISANQYYIATSALSSSFTSSGGASITAEYQINPGNTIYTTGVGWGVPGCGPGRSPGGEASCFARTWGSGC